MQDLAYVAALTPHARAIRWVYYLGGVDGDDSDPRFLDNWSRARAVTVDQRGRVYVAGETEARDFPVTPGVVQLRYGGGTIDGGGRIEPDGFVTVLDPAGTRILASTFLGGSHGDSPARIAVDGSGRVTVAGISNSGDYPTRRPVQASNAGGYDYTLTVLTGDLRQLRYSTYFGGLGEEDSMVGLTLDPRSGDPILSGRVGGNSTDFPTRDAPRPVPNPDGDAFIARFHDDDTTPLLPRPLPVLDTPRSAR